MLETSAAETAKRDELAERIDVLAMQIEKAQRRYGLADDAEAEMIRRHNARRVRELDSLMRDLLARPLRSLADVGRRAKATYQYTEITCDWDETCCVRKALSSIGRFADQNLPTVAALVLVEALVLLQQLPHVGA